MKIGLIAVGLNTYWHQFGGLRERLDGYRNAIKEKMEAYGGQIVADAGMVDDVDKAHAAAALFRRDEAEVLFIFISTYALSSTLIPFLGEGIPVVLLNLQPAPAIDYARLNGMSDRGEMTGEWLANCQACSLPEFCSVFNRAGTKYDVVTGYLDDAQAWAEIYGWIDAAKVACGMRRNRMGLLGNYYGGMVAGLSAIFATATDCLGIPVTSIFDPSNLPDYASFDSRDCPLCKAGQHIDALVNSFGYSAL